MTHRIVAIMGLHSESMHRDDLKQYGGSNQCISVYTAILSLGNKCYHIKSTLSSLYNYAAPALTVSRTTIIGWPT